MRPACWPPPELEVRQLDREVLVASPRLMEDLVLRSFWEKRFFGQLFGAFALLALVLASVGIAAVVSYAVSQRTHEIGVRLALGATQRQVVRLVLKEGLQLAAVGVGIGLLASWGLLRVLRSQLYGISPTNLGVTGLAVLVLSGVALLACYVPARVRRKWTRWWR